MIDSAFFASLSLAQRRKCYSFLRSRAAANDAILASDDDRLRTRPHYQAYAHNTPGKDRVSGEVAHPAYVIQ